MSEQTATATVTVGTQVQYHGSILILHGERYMVANHDPASGKYELIDPNYPTVDALAQVRRASFTVPRTAPHAAPGCARPPTDERKVTMMERHVGTLTHKATGHTVTVTAEVEAVTWHPEPITLTYQVTTDTGYRATLRACCRDKCLNGTMTPCTCLREVRTHRRTHCHAWHDLNALALAKAVLKTFNRHRPGPRRVPAVPDAAGPDQPRPLLHHPASAVRR